MQVPLITAELEKRFSTQIMCTYVLDFFDLLSIYKPNLHRPDIFENPTLVIFVHEL